ncbi:MAG: aspartate/glutamate racemase family protein, partial [Candidatus Omnitrophota bacterium]
MKNNYPVGIFDSGLGGLTVFREIEKILPEEDIIYFGDTAHVPYGGKSKQTIVRFSTENILFLLRNKVKLVVVACNTSSSLALEYLKSIFTVPILGVIDSGVEKAVSVSKTKRVGIIGTAS